MVITHSQSIFAIKRVYDYFIKAFDEIYEKGWIDRDVLLMNQEVLYAEIDGNIVAIATFVRMPDYTWLSLGYVSPKYRNQKIITQLVNRIRQTTLSNVFRLLTHVDNTETQAIMSKLGFNPKYILMEDTCQQFTESNSNE